jgi:hypothetical protein
VRLAPVAARTILFAPLGLLLPLLASAQQNIPGPGTSDMRVGQGQLKYAGNPLVAEGDRWYARRQEGRSADRASALPINRAIAAYDEATRDPDFVDARWKLVRALYFKGAYTGLDADSRKAVFVKARRVAEEAIGILDKSLGDKGIKGLIDAVPEVLAASGLKDRSDAAPVYFWAAVAWGEWAVSTGKVEAAKTGAAEKIRDYASIVIGVDPSFEEGGGYRVLGRLNDQAPWIPFITGWVSREDGVKYLRLAMQQNDRNFVNRHYLAEALWGGAEGEKAEAIRLEEGIVADAPSPQYLIEDLAIQSSARKNLADWKKAS